jgi:hypothetical protein
MLEEVVSEVSNADGGNPGHHIPTEHIKKTEGNQEGTLRQAGSI